jgi:hypothetical protein
LSGSVPRCSHDLHHLGGYHVGYHAFTGSRSSRGRIQPGSDAHASASPPGRRADSQRNGPRRTNRTQFEDAAALDDQDPLSRRACRSSVRTTSSAARSRAATWPRGTYVSVSDGASAITVFPARPAGPDPPR